MKKLELKGDVGKAIIYTVSDEKIAIDKYALAQIKMLCDNEVSRNAKLPSLVGIDIGCGVTMAKIEKFRPEYQRVDKIIRENISNERGIRNRINPAAEEFNFENLTANFDRQRAVKNLGTLGYGNHYCDYEV